MGHRIKQQKKNTNKQTINKQQTKKFSNSITIREMQIKTMFRFHMTPSERWSLRKQWQMLPRTQGKGMLIHCWWHSHSGRVWRCLKALKNRTAQYSISITSGNIPKGFHTCRAKAGGIISHITQQWTLTSQGRRVYNWNSGMAVRGHPATFWLPLWQCRKNLRLEVWTSLSKFHFHFWDKTPRP